MSDDEDIVYVKKQKTIHYGSLEEQERLRLAGERDETEGDGRRDEGNINISDEYMDLEEEMSRDKQALLDEFERRKKARQVHVSTDDNEVRHGLRQLGEPVCLFGEGPAERRVRLREMISRLGEDAIQRKEVEEEERLQQEKDQETTWYHEGPQVLKDCRYWVARYSLVRARDRLGRAREESRLPEATVTARKQEIQKLLTSLNIFCSQIGDTRPVSSCCFSPDGSMLATGSWSGLCKLWSVPACRPLRTLRGHDCNVGAVVFHPDAGRDTRAVSLASCAVDGSVKLWDLEGEEPLADVAGHAPHRVSKLAFHPSGKYLATACYDSSWRLWDLATRKEILHQEGHSAPVHCVSFHCDGSVLASGGLDSFGRLWDLRTGRCIMFMEGHLKSVYALDFSPDGFHIISGSEDNSCKVWDLRQQSCVYTVPAHSNLVSGVRYQPRDGLYLLTSSYDNTSKVWSSRTWQPLRTLSGHDGKVMSLDISPDSKYIATSSFDRTFKLWAPEL